MAVNLKGKSFLTLMDFSPMEIRYLLDLSRDLKAKGCCFFVDMNRIIALYMDDCHSRQLRPKTKVTLTSKNGVWYNKLTERSVLR